MKTKLFLLIIFIHTNVFSQAPDWEWAKSFPGIGHSDSYRLSVDGSGNVYSVGYFGGTVDYDPDSAGTFYLTSNGADDIFISKLDSSGNFVWARSFGGFDSDWANDVQVDASGNVYVTGIIKDTVDLDPGPGTFYLYASTGGNAFISKQNSAGDFIWAKVFAGYYSQGYNMFIDTARNDRVYCTGLFQGVVDFNPDNSVLYNLGTSGIHGGFLSVLDSSGNFVDASSIAGGGYPEIRCFAMDVDGKRDIYLSGVFNGTVDFNPDTSNDFLMIDAGIMDIFICKLDSASNFIWAKKIGGLFYDVLSSFLIEPDGGTNIYLGGWYSGSIDFDPSPSGIFNLQSTGSDDIYICKLDSGGNFIWAKSMGGPGGDACFVLAFDKNKALFAAGSFDGTADLDPDPSAVYNVTSMEYFDAYLQKLDTAGNLQWVTAIGGTWGDEYITSLMFSDSNNACVTGSFQSPYMIVGSITLANADSTGMDPFVAQLEREVVSSVNDLSWERNVSLFPNPAMESVTIICDAISGKSKLEILDVTGRKIYQRQITHLQKARYTIDLSGFPAGIYFVRLQSGERVMTKKFIVAK